jgi:hypothetical protein
VSGTTEKREPLQATPRRRLEPAEVPIWQALEEEVRGEYEAALDARMAGLDENALRARGRAGTALAISVVSAFVVLTPAAALVAGVSWRLMLWAAGYRSLF